MRLIKKIEINYLRSLYSANIDDAGDLNVIFGRNDSGKSNLLRALNLFFNDMIEPGRDLEFDLDMSDRRKKEARDAKGRQFIWIKITFNVPDNYHGSLGEEIAVKRQWNRDGEMTQNVFPPIDSAGKQSRLTRLLNEIDFTYIPAIKDLNVYADLIERMYGAATESDALRDATSAFVSAIEGQTTSLSEQLTSLFGAPAHLAPPTEMSRLFRDLDFSHGEDGHSLLRQKGDGIKARHLPELLRFINAGESRKKFYLWGFEEPENSLDLASAEAEACRFADFSNRGDTQIFITSHSPAFYLSNSDSQAVVRRVFVTKQNGDTNHNVEPKNALDVIDNLEDAEKKMAQAGLLQLPFVIRQMGEQRAALLARNKEIEMLRSLLNELQKPTLFVEGRHDIAVFESAFKRLKVKDVSIRQLGGTPNNTESLLSAIIKEGGLNPTAPTFLLFDNDCAGRKAFKNLSRENLKKPASTRFGKNMHAWVLPMTEEFENFAQRYDISHEKTFFTSEFLYPANAAARLCAKLVKSSRSRRDKHKSLEINGEYWHYLGQERCSRLMQSREGEADWFFARGVPDSLKEKFAILADEEELSTVHIDDIAKEILVHLGVYDHVD